VGDNRKTAVDYRYLFLQSRQAMEVSPGTLSFYRVKLGRFLSELDADTAKRQDIEAFLIQFKNPCNPHAFRRTFACLLRKAGVDTMTIKELGRWESLEMVQRYTRSVTFNDSLKLYKAPLEEGENADAKKEVFACQQATPVPPILASFRA